MGAGVLLVAVAFAAATRVADTREGLIYEVVTLLTGLAGVSLLLYGLVGTFSHQRPAVAAPPVVAPVAERVHNAGELLVGSGGLVLAATLLAGIAATAGGWWALLGSILLLPMIAGCIYLCVTFARGPLRDWKIDIHNLISNR